VKRLLLGILAALMVLAGASVLAVAGWVYAAFGTNGIASTSLGTITSAATSSAVVIDVDTTRVRLPVLPVRGNTTLHLESTSGAPILAGSAGRSEVDAFLGSREIDAAYREHGTWSLTHVPGAAEAGPWSPAPSWLGTGVTRDIEVRDGQTVAIANADGAPAVSVTASLTYTAPHARQAMTILAISGAALALGGLALGFCVIWIMRRKPDTADA